MDWFIFVVVVFVPCVFCAVPVTNDNCTYLFDMERNSIKVTCSKNVTVTIRGKGNTKLLTGNDEAMKYWFEANLNAHNNKTTRSGDFNTKAMHKLKSANRILRKSKKILGKRLVALNVTSGDLEDGDIKLKNDVEILQRYPPGSIFAHQSIVAAIKNQYKYLQMAMLTQNNEMKQLVKSMTSLVSATQKSIRSVMAMGDELQEQLVLLNTALVRCNMTIVNKQK
ncbi:uncharacterized protein LOC134231264, partial [Saccostrea cucullata]|uniref:uncharacterized protein LOC134231264 n=1 Tax=Saccostrea cuccullata TaxID=36930 RepID=UPI002ED1289B